MSKPPFTARICPVMYDDAPWAMNTTIASLLPVCTLSAAPAMHELMTLTSPFCLGSGRMPQG
jgi:hypothetical protein